MAETIYETTIADYETVIGALPANTVDTPYTVRITDIENLTKGQYSLAGNLGQAIKNANRYVNIIWTENAEWSGTDASLVFYDCERLREVDTSPFINVTRTFNMFYYCRRLTSIDTTPFSNVTAAAHMFSSCYSLTSIDTTPFSNVTNAEGMFYDCSSLTSIDTTPFSNVTNAASMFYGCNKITEINTTPFINVINALQMFAYCNYLTSINISPFKNITNAGGMFYNCVSLAVIYISSIEELLNTLVCQQLPAGVTNVFVRKKVSFPYEVESFKISTPSNIQAMTWHYNLEDLKLTTIANYENNVSSLDANTASTPYDIQITDIENLTTNNLKTAIINAGKFVNITWSENAVWNGTDTTEMFYECSPLTSIDTTPFTNITNAKGMFNGCLSLTSIDTSPFINVTNAREMFVGCSALTNIDLRCFINLTNAMIMFYECSSLTSVNTDALLNITNAQGMFGNCTLLKNIDISTFNNLSTISEMFSGCSRLSSIILPSVLNVSKTTSLFSNCTSLESIDISPFINVTNAASMFYNCNNLLDINIFSLENSLNTIVCEALPLSVTDVYVISKVNFPYEINTFKDSAPSNIQAMTWHYVLSDVYPKSTTLANYARNVSSLDVNNSSAPYDIKITDFKNHVATDFSAAIIGGDRFVNLTFDDDTYESVDATSMFEDCTKIVSLDITPFIDIAIGDLMFYNVPIPTLDETLFTKLTSADNMFDGTGKVNFDFTNAKDLDEVTVPSSAKKFLVNDTALKRIDLSEASNLEYLDVSNTNITSLNLINCSSLPYCEWDTINDLKVLVKGWLAKNCTSLLTVKATETQVQDANLNLKNDTNALEGCTALQEVEVACNSRPSYSGNEVHYGTVKFENEVIFNNGLSLGEQALKDIFNICHPIGEKYVQLGGEKYPWEMYPLTKKVDWENISNQYANEFFRVAGSEKPMGYFLTEDTEIVAGKTYYTRSGTDPNYTYTAVASPVVANIGTYYELSTNLTASTINNGDSDYLHEVQQEGLPNITGSYRGGQDGIKNINVIEATGAFYGDDYKSSRDDTSNDRNTTYNKLLKFDASRANPIYGSSEHVTALNSAIQIWKRIS